MILFFIFLTILISAFFSGYEIAFITANKLKIELNKKQGKLSGNILGKFIKQPSHFIGTILVGNNIALIFYSLLMSSVLDKPLDTFLENYTKHFHSLSLLISTIISAVIILIFGEFLPKAIFRINPNGVLSFFAIPFLFIYWLLSPVALLFANLAKWILQFFIGLKLEEKKPLQH